uniref:Gustatory receptor n=1 Tax=Anopheles coluzzii TaxID=1518534 RepID=A0A8W7NZ65_ANOCL
MALYRTLSCRYGLKDVRPYTLGDIDGDPKQQQQHMVAKEPVPVPSPPMAFVTYGLRRMDGGNFAGRDPNRDFYAAQRPVLRVSFLVGMTPFTVVKGPTELMMLRCTPFGYINSSVHVILFCSCYVNALLQGDTITRFFFRTDISTLGDVLQFTIGITALFMTFFCSIFQRNKLIKCFHALASIDRRFKEIGMETNYKSTLHYNLLVMLTKAIISTLYLVVCLAVFISSDTYPSVTTWMAFLLPYFMMSMVIVLFLCFVNQTKHRFHLLNKVLKHLKQAALEKRISPQRRPSYWHAIKIQRPLGIASVYSNNDKSMPDVVSTVAEIQDALCEACSYAEDYFTIQMLTIVTIVFLIIVFNSYYVLDALLGSTSLDSPFSKGQFAMFFLCQAMVYGFGVFNIVYGSSSLRHQIHAVLAADVATIQPVHSLVSKCRNMGTVEVVVSTTTTTTTTVGPDPCELTYIVVGR